MRDDDFNKNTCKYFPLQSEVMCLLLLFLCWFDALSVRTNQVMYEFSLNSAYCQPSANKQLLNSGIFGHDVYLDF